jgi:DNA-binding NarL/FixJ family response regulator
MEARQSRHLRALPIPAGMAAHAQMDEVLPVRAVLVDEELAFRVGLRRALTALGIAIVGEASNGPSALRLVRELHPDVIVIDPELGGIDAARKIAAMHDAPAVLVLADAQTDEVLDALLAGACSVLFKNDDVSDLAEAIRLAARGASSLAPSVAGELVKRLRELEKGRRLAVRDVCPSVLTGREQQVLLLLAQGRNNATIGEELFLSASTVKHHVARILGKLGATSRAQAAAQAARFGLL